MPKIMLDFQLPHLIPGGYQLSYMDSRVNGMNHGMLSWESKDWWQYGRVSKSRAPKKTNQCSSFPYQNGFGPENVGLIFPMK